MSALPFFLMLAAGRGEPEPPPRVHHRRRRRRAPAPRPAPAPAPPPIPTSHIPISHPAKTTVPWPQVTPATLPTFPGPGWVPASPPSAAIVARANQLLHPLWAKGEGTHRVERTGGEWIAYQARHMGSKKGVVAYRRGSVRSHARPSPPRTRMRHHADAVPVSHHRPAPAPAPAPRRRRSSHPLLRRGAKGASVRLAQEHLGVKVDGDFGPNTERAVRAFQAAHGLQVDGVIGPNTWRALLSSPAPEPAPAPAPEPARVTTRLPTLRRGAKGHDVAVAQRRLGIKADGDFGPNTERAVRAWQASHGLQVDGVIGTHTWRSLLGVSA